jgi:predicted transcriptional regulator
VKLNKYITVRVYPDLIENLRTVARLEERSTGSIVRRALAKEFVRHGLLPDTKQQPVAAVTGQGVTHDRE